MPRTVSPVAAPAEPHPGTDSFAIPALDVTLAATLAWPPHPSGLVVVPYVASGIVGTNLEPLRRQLLAAGLGCLAVRIASPIEEDEPAPTAMSRLVPRLLAVMAWAGTRCPRDDFPIACLAAGPVAASALLVVAATRAPIAAVVAVDCDGDPLRAALAGEVLAGVRQPVLLVVPGEPEALLRGRTTCAQLGGVRHLVAVAPGHLAPGAPRFAGAVAARAAAWLVQEMVIGRRALLRLRA